MRLRTLTEALRGEQQALQQQIKTDEARSEGDPSFASDDWRRLGGNRVAEGYIKQAIKALEKALSSLSQPPHNRAAVGEHRHD